MAKIKVYQITKEINNNTRDLMKKIKSSQQDLSEHIKEIDDVKNNMIEEKRKEEIEKANIEKEKKVKDAVSTPIPQNDNAQKVKSFSNNPNNSKRNDSPSNLNNANKNRDFRHERDNRPFAQNTGRNFSNRRNDMSSAHTQQAGGRPFNNRKPPFNNNNRNNDNRISRDGTQGRPENNDRFKKRPYVQKDNSMGASSEITPVIEKEKVSNYDPNKKNYRKDYETEKKPIKTKKEIIKEIDMVEVMTEEGPNKGLKKVRPRKFQNRKNQTRKRYEKPVEIKIEKAVITAEKISIKDLSEKIGKQSSDIIKKLLDLGIAATINQDIDFDTAELLTSEYGIKLEQKLAKSYEEILTDEDVENNPADMKERPPVVTIMGHVDHGKTSLLDVIRKTNVTEHEAGGITQHIGAYTVRIKGKSITFLDTPGHEAFTAMRARGAQATDIVILVVAADDGIMPQTVEAINHAKAANVPIIVAINKIDKVGANPERVKQQLTEYGLVAEEWGGDTVIVPVSAVTKQGLDRLLEMILLVAEVQELKANPKHRAKGTIIEALIDKGRGPVATVLVQNGTLKIGDAIVAGMSYGHVRAMIDDKGKRLRTAGPSQPVEVLGFSDVPEAGDILYAVNDEKLTRQVVEERKSKQKAAQVKTVSKISLDELFDQISKGQVKELNLIIKADVQGSVEAVKQALVKLSNDQVKINAIHGGVGAITETDVLLASASNAIIIGFNVRPDAKARALSEKEKVDMRLYRVIYDAIEDVQKAMKGMLEPEVKEVILGHAEVRQIFKVSSVGNIAGCYVTDGKVARNSNVRLVRDGIVVHEGKLESLKRFKDDAKEVSSGFECGIQIENYGDVKLKDVIESYTNEQINKE